MAPDLNSVPASPRHNVTSNPAGTQAAPSPLSPSLSRQNSTAASRRPSQIYPMSPPPLPLASPGASQHGHGFPPLSPSISGHVSSVDTTGTPMRHPRPMTAAQLHLELEKEQEAVVNRLTRELSALRAHSASVASTASIASSLDASNEASATVHAASARRHRSSSSVSRNGLPPGTYPHRYSVSSQPATTPGEHASAHARDHRSSSIVSTPRYEEVALQKAELEEVKRENEALKQRIRELERLLRLGSDGDTQRGRRGAPETQQRTGTPAD